MIHARTLLLAFVLSLICFYSAEAQKSAPSSHFVYNDNFAGDIMINQVRVPKTGEAMYTYYETLGWRGKGGGYAGIQAHPKAHNFIFSIWDHKQHTAPIKAVHHGPGTLTEKFGGEGTGLKSWNFELGWSTDVWYTLVARNWAVDDHTFYGFWVQAGDTKKWTHMVTMDVAAANAPFEGGTDTFIEDWLNTGVNARESHLRGGWKRKTDGSWFAATGGRYSVNSWDLVQGKRSFDYRTNWNGGVKRDDTGEFYFMTSGGANTKPTASNPSKHEIKRTETEPQFEKLKIEELKITKNSAKQLAVSWTHDATTLPQFSYQIKVYDQAIKGKPVLSVENTTPHARTETLDASGLKPGKKYNIILVCTDILDQTSESKMIPLQLK
ncbi:MAG: DUF3472 domain-containing protein [Pirellulales bacterium]|jgi:hypothetical protein